MRQLHRLLLMNLSETIEEIYIKKLVDINVIQLSFVSSKIIANDAYIDGSKLMLTVRIHKTFNVSIY